MISSVFRKTGKIKNPHSGDFIFQTSNSSSIKVLAGSIGSTDSEGSMGRNGIKSNEAPRSFKNRDQIVVQRGENSVLLKKDDGETMDKKTGKIGLCD